MNGVRPYKTSFWNQ